MGLDEASGVEPSDRIMMALLRRHHTEARGRVYPCVYLPFSQLHRCLKE